MADESRRIRGEVTVEPNAAERVALDLAEKITYKEAIPKDAPRRYYLELYKACLNVVRGGGVPADLREYPERR